MDDGMRRQLLLSLALALFGCGDSSSSANLYDDAQKNQEKAAEELRKLGASVEEKSYPEGQGWVVNFSGKKITDEMFSQLRTLERVTELDFSGAEIVDSHLARVNDCGTLFKLNLSRTAITDTGLGELKLLGMLRELDLSETGVTAAGVARFEAERSQNPQIGGPFKKVVIRR